MGRPAEWDINNVCKQVAYADFGRLLEPFFTGENWDKLMKLRECYQQLQQAALDGDDELDIACIAHGFAEWFEHVFNSIQEEGARTHAAREKELDEFDRILENSRKYAGEMREVMLAMFDDTRPT